MSENFIEAIEKLKRKTGCRDLRDICEIYGYKKPAELFTPVKETEAAEILACSVFTLRNYRHLSKGPNFIKHGSSVRYFPIELLLYNLRNHVILNEVA